MYFLKLFISPDFYISIIRLSTPLIFAAMAALISNKAGVLNINIEGTMLMAALAGAVFSTASGSAAVGLLAALMCGLLMACLFSFFTLRLKADNILCGIALNIFAAGAAVFVIYSLTGQKGDYTSMRLPTISIPVLKDIPLIGKVLFEQNILVYVAFGCVFAVYGLLNSTRLGLRIRSVGENELASKSLGINTNGTKFIALLFTGVFAGLGGAFMSMAYMSTFNTGMIAGRGFIGVAAEAMGSSRPIATMLFSLVFGAISSFSVTAQTITAIPYELLETLPYILTVIGLIAYAVKKQKGRVSK